MDDLKHHTALFFAVTLAATGSLFLITSSNRDDRLFAGALIVLALLFVPIWLYQRKGD